MKRFCTVVLPPPRRTLRPEDAVHWLYRDSHRYFGLVPLAGGAPSDCMEGALWSYALDLFVLVEACGEALARGGAEVVLLDDPRFFHRHTRELELVLEAEEHVRRQGVRTAVRTRLERALRERRRVAASLQRPPRARRQGTRSRGRRGRSPPRAAE